MLLTCTRANGVLFFKNSIFVNAVDLNILQFVIIFTKVFCFYSVRLEFGN